MEYGSDGQIKPVTPIVKPNPPAPLTAEQRLKALEARVAVLEAAQNTAAPAPTIEAAKAPEVVATGTEG